MFNIAVQQFPTCWKECTDCDNLGDGAEFQHVSFLRCIQLEQGQL